LHAITHKEIGAVSPALEERYKKTDTENLKGDTIMQEQRPPASYSRRFRQRVILMKR